MKINKNKIVDKAKMLSDTRVLSLLAFGVVAVLVTWSGIKIVQTNYELEKKISISKQRNEVEKLENENLKLKNTYYQTAQYLELAARRQFGKAVPGEKLYLVPESVALSKTIELPKDQKLPEQTGKPKPKYRQNLDAWADFLFRTRS
jgi:cell division protein FtsB